MKIDSLKIVECNSSEHLMNLWNIWIDATSFMSVGNCEHQTWADLINYGKDHQDESMKFALEYLEEDKNSWPVLQFVNDTIGDPINREKTSGYVPLYAESELYQIVLISKLNELNQNGKSN